MKFIHLKCLQLLVKNKLTTKQTGNCVSFQWKSLDCELCKFPFPISIDYGNGKVVELLEIPKPESQYVILEALCKEKNGMRGIYVVSLN